MTGIPQAPLITTILPTYRRPRLLRRALRSVLAQTYPHFQICVYDNHSGDATAAVVQEFSGADPRVKYICHAENIGMVRNFVQAMNRVETPYFSFLSDDDFLLPDFYATAMQECERYPAAAFASMLTLNVDGQCRLHSHQVLDWRAGCYAPPEGLRAFLKNGFLTWTAMLFRSDIVKPLGPLDGGMEANTDTEYVLRVVSHCPFVVRDKVGAVLVSHEGSYGFTTRFESVWPALAGIIHKITHDESLEAGRREELRVLLETWHTRIIFKWCIQFTLMKDFESARKTARLLRELYGRNAAALLLGAIPRLCRAFPPARWAGAGLNRMREAIVRSEVDDSKLALDEVRRIFQPDEQTPVPSGVGREFS